MSAKYIGKAIATTAVWGAVAYVDPPINVLLGVFALFATLFIWESD